MAILRIFLFFAGALLTAGGCFFALQGASIVMWPAESFMLADGQWVINGLLIALAGIAVVLVARRMR